MASQPGSSLRLSWSVWFLWIAVSAAMPIFPAAATTALFKQILPSDPHAELIRLSLEILIALAIPAPFLFQWAVLRRAAPGLRLWMWLLAAVISLAVAVVLALNTGTVPDASREFWRAMIGFRNDVTFPEFLGLPWGRLLFWTAVATGVTALAPAWVFARAAGLRWYVPWVAAIAGACCAAIADQMYHLYGLHGFRVDLQGAGAMNGWSWTDRARELIVRGAAAGAGGAISGLVVAWFVRGDTRTEPPVRLAISSPRGLSAMLAAALGIAVVAPVCAALLDPLIRADAANRLSKAFSFTPSNDVSEGEEVLRYSHTAAVETGQYALAEFSPDGRTFVILAGDKRLLRVDTASGKVLGEVGEPLRRYERHALAWSPDGQFLALRTDGEEVRIPKTIYTRNRARFRLYALPEVRLVGDYSHRDDECFDSYADPSMMFEAGGKSLWVVCTQYWNPGPRDVMAIRLEVPSMRVLELRRYGDGAASEAVRGLARIGQSVWYWQHGSLNADRFRIGDLTRNRLVLFLPDLKEPRFADGFTAQDTQVTETRITLRYLGGPIAAQWVKRSLVFDTRSGNLIEKKDEPQGPPDFYRHVLRAPDQVRVETTSRDDSKAGDIEVFDATSGRRRQHIRSLAQRPAGISADGRWLVMHAFEEKTLRLYRVAP